MKTLLLTFLFLYLSAQFCFAQNGCNATNCVAPACRCASFDPPGGLTKANTPQLVFLAFDGAITTTNIANYTAILKNRLNPNGCPISMTFFAYHPSNDYNLTHGLYYKGQEIATHSVSHTIPASDWAEKTTQQWVDEIGGMQQALVKFANIPKASIRGAKSPYLQSSGDVTFQAMQNVGMLYDVSYPSIQYTNPPIWPYTLDQGFQHDCLINPCPTGKYRGTWTIPMIGLRGLDGILCTQADACSRPANKIEGFNYLKNNFLRHYQSNKAPFGIHLTATSWFQLSPYNLDAYLDFLDYLGTLDDVYIVSMGKAIDWMRNPVPLSQVPSVFSCPYMPPSTCNPRNCYYDAGSSPVGDVVMMSCVTCPDLYPWTGNPLGTIA